MKLKLIAKKPEASDVISFILEPESPISWNAGQYMHYKFPHENMDDRGDERWFTISAAPFEGHLMITTRFTPDKGSSFKNALKNLEIGSELEADGPEGDFTLSDVSKKYVFIAGGIGITPFRSILLQLNHEGKQFNVDLFYGNRNEEYVFESELNNLKASQPNFRIFKFSSPKKIEIEDIKKEISDFDEPIYYVSGPVPMVMSFKDELLKAGIQEDHIKIDDFPGYEVI